MQRKILKGLRSAGIAALCLLLLAGAAAGTMFAGLYSHKKGGEGAVKTILQLTDVHLYNEDGKDKKAFDTMTKIIKDAKPDLIVVTGDVTGVKENMRAYRAFCEFMESFKLPWGVVYGNHDAEEGKAYSKTQLSDYLESLEYCFYQRGPENVDGEGNYYYNITGDSGKVILSLIMLDSNMYYFDPALGENNGYDVFHENQIRWYADTVKEIAREVNGDESSVVPSLAFFHIPMREYIAAYDEAKSEHRILDGRKREPIGCSKHDDEMFETMKALGSTKACFAGHDHMNSFAVEYQGICLTYGYSCDHNIYPVPQRGGKLIYIREDGSFTQQGVYRWRGYGHLCYGREF